MEAKYVVEVVVEGPPNSGKTTVAILIEKALKDYGFTVEADLRFMEMRNGEKIQDLGVEQFESKKRHIFDDNIRNHLTSNRKVIIKQRPKPRGEL